MRRNFDDTLIYMPLMWMMKMAIMEIIGVTVVGHGCMAAAWSMGMGVIFNNMTGGFHSRILGYVKS